MDEKPPLSQVRSVPSSRSTTAGLSDDRHDHEDVGTGMQESSAGRAASYPRDALRAGHREEGEDNNNGQQ
ncbi:hypothetical protein EYF80_039499 [Liparis tanakae]|uniref:Uncharacterized protein n=1 Tax=Liparis tanakae TaxID=230148 RepID=A0A4Z2GC43_9TELE|nr:hypothetical protein EYF80_039499 [Liparis tanakae]